MSKVVLVTGGSSGIGLAICKVLSEKGYKVYGTSRKGKGATEYPFQMVAMDVTKEETILEAVEAIVQKEGKIDVLVNNAGLGIAGALEDTPTEKVEQVFSTNVFGILKVSKAVLPHMRWKKRGTIINVSSIAGQMGLPFRGIYSASKFAVEAITETLSMEVKPFGIDVCVIEPGDFKTNINENRVIAESPDTSPYKTAVDQMIAQVNEEVAEAGNPNIIGELVHQIIRTKKPKLRYPVGKPMQKLSIKIKRLVSGRMFEKILLNHYKIE